jgi:two-component system response regulator RegA
MNEQHLPIAGSRFLLVDDDDRLRDRMARALRDRGYQVEVADGPEQALAKFDAGGADYALLDLRMPGGSGLDLTAALRGLDPNLQIVVLTGYGSIATAVEAVRLGASNYLSKPADADMVLAAFARGGSERPSEAPDYQAPSLARAEWEHINRVLEDCGGNVTKAARVLGLHRRTLQRKLQKYPPRQ